MDSLLVSDILCLYSNQALQNVKPLLVVNVILHFVGFVMQLLNSFLPFISMKPALGLTVQFKLESSLFKLLRTVEKCDIQLAGCFYLLPSSGLQL